MPDGGAGAEPCSDSEAPETDLVRLGCRVRALEEGAHDLRMLGGQLFRRRLREHVATAANAHREACIALLVELAEVADRVAIMPIMAMPSETQGCPTDSQYMLVLRDPRAHDGAHDCYAFFAAPGRSRTGIEMLYVHANAPQVLLRDMDVPDGTPGYLQRQCGGLWLEANTSPEPRAILDGRRDSLRLDQWHILARAAIKSCTWKPLSDLEQLLITAGHSAQGADVDAAVLQLEGAEYAWLALDTLADGEHTLLLVLKLPGRVGHLCSEYKGSGPVLAILPEASALDAVGLCTFKSGKRVQLCPAVRGLPRRPVYLCYSHSAKAPSMTRMVAVRMANGVCELQRVSGLYNPDA